MPEPLDQDVQDVADLEVVQKVLEVVCRTTGLGFAVVARVTEDRWVACAVRDEINFGLQPAGELDVRTTLCQDVRKSGREIVIDHVAEDTEFCDHATPRQYGFQSYISVPIRLPSGDLFGTLCGLDPKPIKVSEPATVQMFRLFAELIGLHLSSRRQAEAAETRAANAVAALADEREAAHFREQFVAVLGHDLRNPLGAVRSAADVLAVTPRDPDDAEMIAVIQRSVTRMAGLIENVTDFARSRLGDGITVRPVPTTRLPAALEHVVTELRTAYPARTIETDLALDGSFVCDVDRVGQLLSNLLANALTHGDPLRPVRVSARRTHFDGSDETLELSVTNHGLAIRPEVLRQLFEPFVRGAHRPGSQGLGLGLYIASEIARAHGGTMHVESSAAQTRFTLRMPTGMAPDSPLRR